MRVSVKMIKNIGIYNFILICLMFLELNMCDVLIPVCVPVKQLVFLWIRTCLKNSSKIGFVAVDLTKVSYKQNRSTNYFISSNHNNSAKVISAMHF